MGRLPLGSGSRPLPTAMMKIATARRKNPPKIPTARTAAIPARSAETSGDMAHPPARLPSPGAHDARGGPGGPEGWSPPARVEAPPEPVVPCVGVVVVRDVADVVVDSVGVLPEPLVGDRPQRTVQPLEHLSRRRGVVRAPDHHRHLADLAVGDPAL